MIIDINRLSDTGEGIGKVDNKVIFIPKTCPGDTVLVKDATNYKKYMIANDFEIIHNGIIRCDVNCPYYDVCGGCQLMHINYEEQLKYKKNKVINMFKKYANIDINPEIVGSSQFNYRNKITLEVKDGKLGLYKYHSHDVIDIDNCLLVNDKINSIIGVINDKVDLSLVKSVTIRISDKNNAMVLFDGEIKNIDNLKEYVDSIYVNNNLVYGSDNIVTNIGNYSFNVSNKSFFQINNEQVLRLYNKIYEYLPVSGNIMDLYCGTGSIGIYVSDKCKSILGVEINNSAIMDANRNKDINNIKNISFECGDVEDIINSHDYFDSIIVDPPRAGLSNKTKNIDRKSVV